MKWTLVAALLLVSGCVPVQPTHVFKTQRLPYDEAEFAALATKGTGVVEGQIFLKTRGGDVKKGAGEEIQLNPVTSLSKQWYMENYLGGHPLSDNVDPRYVAHIIKVQADGDGNFRFEHVPPGSYFLVGKVTWEVPSVYTAGLSMQGGFIAKKVTVKDGETVRVMLTR